MKGQREEIEFEAEFRYKKRKFRGDSLIDRICGCLSKYV